MEVFRYHFLQIDSTNSWAKQNVQLFDPTQLILVTANEQTAGRGRFNRLWVSPAGQNIYATFCFCFDRRRLDLGNMPQVLSITAARLLKKRGFNSQIKWPNDLMIENKKIGGILCETVQVHEHLWVVLGIGLNVNMPLELLQSIDRPAASLFSLDGIGRDCEEILKELENSLRNDLTLFIKEGFAPFLESYLGLSMHQKRDSIRFHDNQFVWKGAFEEISPEGSLVLLLPSGERRIFIAGEIF